MIGFSAPPLLWWQDSRRVSYPIMKDGKCIGFTETEIEREERMALAEERRNANEPDTSGMKPWQRNIAVAFAGPIYFAAMAGLGRGLFTLALPTIPYNLAPWIGVGVGLAFALAFLAAVEKEISTWRKYGHQ